MRLNTSLLAIYSKQPKQKASKERSNVLIQNRVQTKSSQSQTTGKDQQTQIILASLNEDLETHKDSFAAVLNRYSTENTTGHTTKSKIVVDFNSLLSKGDSGLIATIQQQKARRKGKSLNKLKETLMLNQSASEPELQIKPYTAGTAFIDSDMEMDELDSKYDIEVNSVHLNPTSKHQMYQPSFFATEMPNYSQERGVKISKSTKAFLKSTMQGS